MSIALAFALVPRIVSIGLASGAMAGERYIRRGARDAAPAREARRAALYFVNDHL